MWPFTKKQSDATQEEHPKKVQRWKKNIQPLEQEEERIQRKELQYCSAAIKAFTKAGYDCCFFDDNAYKKEWVVFESEKDMRAFSREIDRAQRALLNIRTYAQRVEKLAQRLQDDLVDIREGTYDDKARFLSGEDNQVLMMNKEVGKHVDQLVKELKELTKNSLRPLMNQEGVPADTVKPRSPFMGKRIRMRMISVHRGMNGLRQQLRNLYKLEEDVEQLTEEYVHA